MLRFHRFGVGGFGVGRDDGSPKVALENLPKFRGYHDIIYIDVFVKHISLHEI